MRRLAILIVVAGLSAVGASPAAAQVFQVPLPDLSVLQVPDDDPPDDDDGGGPGGGGPGGGGPGGGGPGGEDPGGEDPGGEDPGGEDPGGEDPGGEDPGGEDPGGEDPGGEDRGGAGGDGSGAGGSGLPGAASGDAGVGLLASRSDGSPGGGANGVPGGVLEAFREERWRPPTDPLQTPAATSQPPTADGAPLGEGDSAASLLGGTVLALAALGLLVGIAGGLRALHHRQGYP